MYEKPQTTYYKPPTFQDPGVQFYEGDLFFTNFNIGTALMEVLNRLSPQYNIVVI
jgi:hypothetical protein